MKQAYFYTQYLYVLGAIIQNYARGELAPGIYTTLK